MPDLQAACIQFLTICISIINEITHNIIDSKVLCLNQIVLDKFKGILCGCDLILNVIKHLLIHLVYCLLVLDGLPTKLNGYLCKVITVKLKVFQRLQRRLEFNMNV